MKKNKFTIIDVIIILLVLMILAVGITKIYPKVFNKSAKQEIECQILLTEQEQELAGAMHEGDSVTLNLKEKDGGIIKKIESKPSEKAVFDSINGVYIKQILENKYDIYVTVTVEVETSDISLKTGGVVLKVGDEIPVRGKGYASMGYVIGIND